MAERIAGANGVDRDAQLVRDLLHQPRADGAGIDGARAGLRAFSRRRILRAAPFTRNLQPFTREEPRAAEVPLNLPAGRPRDAQGMDEQGCVKLDAVLLRHRLADCRDGLFDIQLAKMLAFHLADHHQPFFPVDIHAHGSGCVQSDRGVAGFNRTLDILRVMIPAADDDQVLDAPGNEKLSAKQESKIAGPQERTIAAGQACLEYTRGVGVAAPVPLCDVRPGHPDFANLSILHRCAGIRVHYREARTGGDPSGTHQPARVGLMRGSHCRAGLQ